MIDQHSRPHNFYCNDQANVSRAACRMRNVAPTYFFCKE